MSLEVESITAHFQVLRFLHRSPVLIHWCRNPWTTLNLIVLCSSCFSTFLSFCWNTMRLKEESFTRTGPNATKQFTWRWVSPVLGSWAVTHTRVHIHCAGIKPDACIRSRKEMSRILRSMEIGWDLNFDSFYLWTDFLSESHFLGLLGINSQSFNSQSIGSQKTGRFAPQVP